MTLTELLTSEQMGPVFRPLFKAQNGRVTAIRLQAGEVIKEHKSPVPAMLLVVEGIVQYEQPGEGITQSLGRLEYIDIPPDTIHQVMAETDAYCLLIQ